MTWRFGVKKEEICCHRILCQQLNVEVGQWYFGIISHLAEFRNLEASEGEMKTDDNTDILDENMSTNQEEFRDWTGQWPKAQVPGNDCLASVISDITATMTVNKSWLENNRKSKALPKNGSPIPCSQKKK